MRGFFGAREKGGLEFENGSGRRVLKAQFHSRFDFFSIRSPPKHWSEDEHDTDFSLTIAKQLESWPRGISSYSKMGV